MSNNKKTVIIFAGVAILIIMGIILFSNKNNNSEKLSDTLLNKSNLNTEPRSDNNYFAQEPDQDFKIPFSYDLPEGWSAQKQARIINTIEGGGPTTGIDFKSPHPSKLWPGSNVPYVSFEWFHFNPNSSLLDIVPLIDFWNPAPPTKETSVGERKAIIAIYSIDQINVPDGTGGPPYLSKYFLLRLNSSTIFKILINYEDEKAYELYQEEVQQLIKSIQFNEG